MGASAVELTTDQAWYLAEVLEAGTYPWVLAITPAYSEPAQRSGFAAEQTAELTRMGVLDTGGEVNPRVAQWIRLVCRATQWLDLRFVSGPGDLLRGIVARLDGRTVVVLRNAQLVTFTEMDINHPHALVPVLTAGLSQRRPARFEEFALPAAAGARADEQIRNGTPLLDVLGFLGVPASARPIVESVFDGRRTYVEIVAGEHRDGHRVTTQVGVSIIDTPEGRILVSPSKAFDGEWISTFTTGTAEAIAMATERLTGSLPSGSWFPDQPLTRNFDEEAVSEYPAHRDSRSMRRTQKA
ncbi:MULTISPECIES: ESX secretion-associated protein EspG [unclassified Mycolicibacterium]|uniref:ESX secretion-associated protein EspG n=1 Tax=unclassified Mycolicibacterium TaxID=2636767 RepID=UPI0013057B74|nr:MULTISPECIES: ESX secretion-associated protein EspG [unclassified Mycolicibacterium]MUL82094.1 ESX secretion-associated protein EspG [Mycolicibacterium sp. CBMA 329]MUL87860.1 ESX secretion-associated protein EspG [Mycolicibacterium sp. CBMA 331]MUM01683.1 ESX secretion-associated protein EspG [Mycolicibacterium sp. CBMA 334]MUM28419.1 ESX secretion-associated protein EspG [Mycolicibacterium sp. CBMA 295]MUM38157.1 ESX secretion-associated protein EspG [Mycolicibacterium sp. CBMA 247]